MEMNKNRVLSSRTKLTKELLNRPWVLASLFVSFAVLLFMMFFFNYEDTSTFLIWSVEWLDCLFGKTDMSFVDYTALNLHGGVFPTGCDHSILQILPSSIWNIPVWVIYRLKDKVIIDDLFGRIWFKTGLVICVVFLAREVASIVKIINKEADHILAYPLVFASVDILISTMFAGQDEILYLLTLIISLRMLLLDRKKAFLLFATITVSLYPVMLIPLLAMLVYKEKRVGVILLMTVTTCVPTMVVSVLEKRIPLISRALFIEDDFMRGLYGSGITFNQSLGSVPVVVVVIVILLFYSFVKKNDDYQMIWTLSALTFAITLLSSDSKLDYFYRSILYVPFCIILLLISKQNISTNALLLAIYSLIRTWISMCIYKSALSTASLAFGNELTDRMFNNYGYVYVADYYAQKMPVLKNMGLIVAVCIAIACVFLYINYGNNQSRIVNIFNINRDKMVFATTWVTPLIVLIIVNAFYQVSKDSVQEAYNCHLYFGMAHYEEIYNSDSYYSYANKTGVHHFHDRAVVDSGFYMSGGYDDVTTRHLPSGGVSYGPYFTLYEGEYQITINGSNLDYADFDCTGFVNDEYQLIDKSNINISENQITYTIELNQQVSGMEFRIFNNNENEVILNEIYIQELTA